MIGLAGGTPFVRRNDFEFVFSCRAAPTVNYESGILSSCAAVKQNVSENSVSHPPVELGGVRSCFFTNRS